MLPLPKETEENSQRSCTRRGEKGFKSTCVLIHVPVPRLPVSVKPGPSVVADPQSVTDEDVEELRGQGLSEAEIVEVMMVSAFARFLNIWADVSGVEIDAEFLG